MKIYYKFALLFFAFNITVTAQNYRDRLTTINIEHYKLNLALNDSTNNIDATMTIEMRFRRSTNSFVLDLASINNNSKTGMQVDSIYQNKVPVEFKHENDRLTITPKHNFPNLTYTYTIKYHGIPDDGLIIGKNMFEDRTFFGDNWPNRAHNWFPCVDHPSDKATIEYLIKAPNHYKVIANGKLIEEIELENNFKQTHWKTEKPLPTKIMVIGVSKFAIDSLGETHKIPVTTWVYPQNKTEGFYDFENTKSIFNFYIELFGDYPFSKLASVQSSTRYGGMENASAIFYPESAVTGKQTYDNTIAHEIVHQWFGDSASEIDWPHVWLSEGFATYFTDIYVLKTKGDSIFQKRMQRERSAVLRFYKNTKTPVVDTKTTNYLKLLNPNSYQKGAWVLHMLRRKLGDTIFYEGIKAYYDKYKFRNASTTSFKNVMAQISGQNLDLFFKQWLEKAGHPVIKTQWIYFNKKVRLIVDQIQKNMFEFPLDIELIYADGTSEIKTIQIEYQNAPYVIETNGDVKELKFDPNTWLLFDTVED